MIFFADPYKQCLKCRGWIVGVNSSHELLHARPELSHCTEKYRYDDVCPSWGPVDGCTCDPVDHDVPVLYGPQIDNPGVTL